MTDSERMPIKRTVVLQYEMTQPGFAPVNVVIEHDSSCVPPHGVAPLPVKVNRSQTMNLAYSLFDALTDDPSTSTQVRLQELNELRGLAVQKMRKLGAAI